jgi:hypothetical protein
MAGQCHVQRSRRVWRDSSDAAAAVTEEEAISDWLACEGPALLDVHANRMELVMPPKVEIGQVASTALFGIKAVLNGRASEVLELLG